MTLAHSIQVDREAKAAENKNLQKVVEVVPRQIFNQFECEYIRDDILSRGYLWCTVQDVEK